MIHSPNAIHFSTKLLGSGYVDLLQRAAVQCPAYFFLASRHRSAVFTICSRGTCVKALEETTEPDLKE